jgi:hypothetical protein
MSGLDRSCPPGRRELPGIPGKGQGLAASPPPIISHLFPASFWNYAQVGGQFSCLDFYRDCVIILALILAKENDAE